MRPSGTEPKLKCYLEVVVPVEGVDAGAPLAPSVLTAPSAPSARPGAQAAVAAARLVAAHRLADLRSDLIHVLGLTAQA